MPSEQNLNDRLELAFAFMLTSRREKGQKTARARKDQSTTNGQQPGKSKIANITVEASYSASKGRPTGMRGPRRNLERKVTADS